MKKVTCIRPVWQLAELEGDLSSVGGLDIHRKQITSDYLAMITGEVRRGRVAPADRAHLRAGWPGWSTREESACNAAAARGDKRRGFTEADYARAARCRTRATRGPLVVVWDNSNTHVSDAMGERVAARDWLRVYQLPPYAHELNPVDGCGRAGQPGISPRRAASGRRSSRRRTCRAGPRRSFPGIRSAPPRPLAWMRTEAGSPMLPGDMPRSICSHCWLIPTRPR